ncbi:hypothetical protein ACWOE5_04780 [Aerococcus sanguinicola]|uniref:Uncharacterized protein n=1 Tax=Aerococcus sanguinicola TaxID=119206 RepID=A0A2I1MQB5_9LACT|nr:hypothetical protein [Aerococcus sanguinicola]PKZ22344.1 hypothetical protein CYJ28_04310 [Aerococcus sanguinicola]
MNEISFLLTAPLEDILSSVLINEELILFDYTDKHQNSSLSNGRSTGKYMINSIMDFSKTFFINKKILDKEYVKSSYILSLDSNVLGDLKNCFVKENENSDLLSMIALAKKNNMRLDFNPYVLENTLNNYYFEDEILYKHIEAFNTADSFDPVHDDSLQDAYERNQDWISFESQNKYDEIKSNYNSSNLNQILNYYHNTYILLLKTFLIKFDSKIKSNNKKIDVLIDFITSNLRIYGENEFVIAVFGIRNNKTLSNFLTVQPNSKDKINKIRGMAWDLAHIRYLEMMMRDRIAPDNIFLAYFLSADKGLSQTINLNPVQRILFEVSDKGKRAIFRRKYNTENISLSRQQIDKIREWRFTQKAQLTVSEYKNLSSELEEQMKFYN